MIHLDGEALSLPGLATAHSHAFQRALRGRTHRPLAPSRGGASFWSWRGLMYELAAKLDPDTIYALSRYAYVELAMSGVTAVGEFHYVHHQPDGQPYDDRTALADAVVRAAIDAGLRVCLLRVLYQRPGLGRALEPTQRRFSDADVDDALRDVETLRARWAAEPRVRVGVAPHSVRAVPLEGVRAGGAFAEEHNLPFHMHVSEQRREVRECLAEHGRRPVQLLADEGVLTDRFVGVHATHLDAREIAALGASRAFACVCRTTERDLGDGLPSLTPMLAAGARLCFGTDSHAISDPFEEARATELDERSRLERRALVDAGALLGAASAEGYAAIGMAGLETEDRVTLDGPELAGAAPPYEDAVVFAANARCVRTVEVAGARIVEDGVHRDYAEARADYERAVRGLIDG